jgi:hypothetical protein
MRDSTDAGAQPASRRTSLTNASNAAKTLAFRGNSATVKRKVSMLLSSVQAELERERSMRVYVFPRLKRDGKLTDAEAAQRLERLSGAMEVLQLLQDAGIVSTRQLADHLDTGRAVNTKEGNSSFLPIIKGGAQ